MEDQFNHLLNYIDEILLDKTGGKIINDKIIMSRSREWWTNVFNYIGGKINFLVLNQNNFTSINDKLDRILFQLNNTEYQIKFETKCNTKCDEHEDEDVCVTTCTKNKTIFEMNAKLFDDKLDKILFQLEKRK